MGKIIKIVTLCLVLLWISACSTSSQETTAVPKEETATVETSQSYPQLIKLKSIEFANGFVLVVPDHWEVEGGNLDYNILRFISEEDLVRVDLFAFEEDRQTQEERFRTDDNFVPITLSETEGYVEKKVETVEGKDGREDPKYLYTYSFNINGKYTLTAGFYAVTDRLGDEGIDDIMQLILESVEDYNP